jgi:hypothetical protein
MDRLPRCLERLQRLAALHGVSEHLTPELAIVKGGAVASSRLLGSPPPDLPAFFESQYGLVMCVRFLERDFVERLNAMVRPGGFLLFVSFVRVEGVVYESPKDPKKLLEGA